MSKLILLLFLGEAVALSALGGFLGLLLGFSQANSSMVVVSLIRPVCAAASPLTSMGRPS